MFFLTDGEKTIDRVMVGQMAKQTPHNLRVVCSNPASEPNPQPILMVTSYMINSV